MNRIKIAVIFGGMSTEHDVSIVSGISVMKNLNQEKYEIVPIYIDKKGIWYQYTKPIHEIGTMEVGNQIKELENIQEPMQKMQEMDCIFPVLHGLYGEDGSIQGLLELLKIPYVGCRILASSVSMDKVYTKIIFEKAGLKQAPYVYLRKEKEQYQYYNEVMEQESYSLEEVSKKIEAKIAYPMFIKPSNSGSSVGVSKAKNKQELEKAIQYASNYDKKIIVEQGINGRELECAVLGNEEVKASMIGEILAAEEFYDFESKYHNQESKTIIPKDIPEEIVQNIREQAIKAFKAVDGKGLSRVDFFLEKETNHIIINEINTMPGFTNISMYPKLWEESGLSYPQLLDTLIELAMDNK